MAQHDYSIANQSGASFRSDLNNALSAIVSQNSGTAEPSTTYAYQMWADTTNGVMKLRNAANNAWITLYQLDGEWSVIPFENGSAAAPSIYFKDSGTDTGFFSAGTDQVNVTTGGTERVEWGTSEVVFNDSGANYDFRVEGDTNANLLFVDASADAVGIGTSSPSAILHTVGTQTAGTIRPLMVDNASGSGTSLAGISFANSGNIKSSINAAVLNDDYMTFCVGGSGTTERVRIDGSGRVGIGTTTVTNLLHLRSDSSSNVDHLYLQNRNGGANSGARIAFSNGTVDYGDSRYAYIGAVNTGASESGNHLVFATNANGGSATEKARIDSSGNFGIGQTSPGAKLDVNGNIRLSAATPTIEFNSGGAQIYAPGANSIGFATGGGIGSPNLKCSLYSGGQFLFGTTTLNPGIGNNTVGCSVNGDGYGSFARNDTALYIARTAASNGDMVEFFRNTVKEGSISVSGTTVSYNGAHLSRWSQLPGGQEREEILRGTVLSNIDEMCEWGSEENEQLNRMKVSDIEGDKNVSGVFDIWDDDDDTYTNDFYCAMTGDFIIRIAEGVTVERGDLLMSAGDGTAKPQDDDIIRSKTIAKVTSTNVSCTYEDGSYCVPCVLMAC